MKDKIFIAIIFISLIYVFLVLYFRRIKIRQVVTKNDVSQKVGKVDAIADDVISYPNKLIVNLIYNEKEDLNLGLFSDMSIRYPELVAGTYKVPEHLKIKNKINMDASIQNKTQTPKQVEQKLKVSDVPFDNLVDITKKMK